MEEKEEVVIDLLQKEGLRIIQRPDYFNFSIDSVLLAEFITINKGSKKIVDLGTGNGAIPLLLSKRTTAKIIGLEIQDVSADLARRNMKLNNLEDRVTIVEDDMKNWREHIPEGSIDSVISNPPYFPYKGNKEGLNNLDQLTYARHEITINLEGVVEVGSRLLRDRGYFGIVHRAERVADIFEYMRKYKIEPKRVLFCYSKKDRGGKTVLVEGIKYGNKGLKVLPPLFTHNDDGSYSDEVLEMFK